MLDDGQAVLCLRAGGPDREKLAAQEPDRLARFLAFRDVRVSWGVAGTSKQAVNPLINDLERWGYLKRRPDPADGRGRVLRLTDCGHELMVTIKRLHAQIEAEWERDLGTDRFHILRSTLRELVEGHAEAPGPPPRNSKTPTSW